jgi:anion-transporting  ArsA/GET3 family ATPase
VTSILDKRLILVAGKGGVGRSTVAASIAAATAKRGRRTLLFQSQANDRFADMFGSDPISTEVTRIRQNLYAVNTNPAAALEEYGMMVLKFRSIYKLVFENRLTKYFLRAIPGLDDYAILGKAWYHTTEKAADTDRWDTIVFDLPASGHCVSMLKIPWVITETVPDGPLTRDARTVKGLLTDPKRTALVMVTLAEEMPANEAKELSDVLRSDLNIDTTHVLINQVYPQRFAPGTPPRSVLDALLEATDLDSELQSLATHGALAKERRALNEEYIERLSQSIDAPQSRLPLLFSPRIGSTELETLTELVEEHFSKP